MLILKISTVLLDISCCPDLGWVPPSCKQDDEGCLPLGGGAVKDIKIMLIFIV